MRQMADTQMSWDRRPKDSATAIHCCARRTSTASSQQSSILQ
jgi:hypothetical protein